MVSESPDRSSNEGPAARYANYLEIGHNAAEFVLDFGQGYSTVGEDKVHTRLITSPAYAKAFLRLLEKAVKRHERVYGEINED